MALLPDSVREIIPPADPESQNSLKDATAVVRFYEPSSQWEWFVIGFDGIETFSGVITNGKLALAGNFTLSELEGMGSIQTGSKTVERDDQFEPQPISRIAEGREPVQQLLEEVESRLQAAPSDLVTLE
jgi:hypothetical protein